MRIVVDTNVVASGIFFGGRPRELLSLIVSLKLKAFASLEIITEYQETIEELCSRYPNKPPRLPLTDIVAATTLIEPTTSVHVCRDPDDDKFIACAVDGKCLYIVSGDKDLLSLKQYGNVKIVTVAEFFDHYAPTRI